MKNEPDVIQAIRTNDLESFNRLVTENAVNAEAKDETGTSALLLSIYFGRKEMTARLLERRSETTFLEACAAGLSDRVQQMVRTNPSIVNERSHDGWTPLHLASFFGHAEVARTLLDAGADVTAISKNREANLPINAAGAGRHSEIVRLLIDRGCPVDARGSDAGYTPLHLAAHEGNADLIRFLLKRGADRSLKNAQQETAADIAKKQGHGDEIQSLFN
jgi:uncharacterized protein